MSLRSRRLTAAALAALIAATGTTVVTAGPATAQPLAPTATFDPLTTAWTSVRDASDAGFATRFAEREKAGDMVIDLDVDQHGGEQRVAAVFRPNPDGRGWESRRQLDAATFGATWAANRDRGYRLVGFESYRVGNEQRYAGHWVENREKLGWASVRDRTSEQFTTTAVQYERDGMMPIDVDAYATAQGLRYASVWVANPDRLRWAMKRDMTAEAYEQAFAANADAGLRVHTIESYLVDGKQRYAALWVENRNGRGWAGYRDMDANGFRNRWNRLRDMGYRLDDIERYDTAAGPRYAGVWRQNSDRPDWGPRAKVDELVTAHRDAFSVPGISVAITHQGRIVYQRGFGHQDVAGGTWMHANTVNRLASVSKAVAGVLAFDVLEDHADVTMGDPVRDHLPWLPAHHTYSLAQSLMNRSCVASYPAPLTNSWTEHYDTAADAVPVFMDEALVCTPGTYEYSTAAYSVACAVLEDAEGTPIDRIVTDRLARPFAVPTLGVENPAVADRSRIYGNDNTELDADDQSWKTCGGGLQASARDLAQFGLRLLDGSVLSAADRTELWTPIGNRAYGWDVGTADSGERVVGKAGGQPGANTYWRIYPDDDIQIVVLTNRWKGGHSAADLSKAIGEHLLDVL